MEGNAFTRVDVAKSVNALAEHQTNPGPHHIKAADDYIAYLYSMRSLVIEYTGGTEIPQLLSIFQIASDLSFADDVNTWKSSEGYLFKLFGRPIDWRATKQKMVTRSTTEAELLVLSTAAREAIWWTQFFNDIKFDAGETLTIEYDNKQTVGLMAKDSPKLDTKLRHIDIHQH